MEVIEQAKKILEENNQNKILGFFDKISQDEQEQLASEILKIDFDKINKMYSNRESKNISSDKIEPIKYIDKNNLDENTKSELDNLGKQVISNGEYAVVTMAGGQGTRLGWKGPKGTFKLDIGENGKYIFEILTDTLKKASKDYGVEPYWYIMTSIENNEDTIAFFEEHNYFGYNKHKVKFFKQSVLPVLDFEGNLLVTKDSNNNYIVKEASNGNGEVFKALKDSNLIDDMKNHNIKWIYICGVDNILANMVDSTLLGLAIKNNIPSASKSVKKAYPEERVGIFCKKNGKPAIIEYIDMTEEMIYAKDEKGELLYGESNFVAHLFNISTLENLAEYDFKYHCAKKKNTYISSDLTKVIPEEPNTYKFEAFIFDGFEALSDMVVLRVNREEEFAPIKNAEGVDSPQTATKLYNNLNNV